MIYYFKDMDTSFMVYRRGDGILPQVFSYTEDDWVEDWDMFDGELSLEPITKEEANAAITSRKSALAGN